MSERYKREIEDILRQAGELAPKGSGRGPRTGFMRLAWLRVVDSVGGKAWSISPGRVMLVAVALLLSALLVGSAVPGSTAPLAWAGLILFIVGYAMFFIRPPKVEKRWRGQPVDKRWQGQPVGGGESWWGRLRRRMRK